MDRHYIWFDAHREFVAAIDRQVADTYGFKRHGSTRLNRLFRGGSKL